MSIDTDAPDVDCPHIKPEDIENLSARGYLVSPFFREPIRDDFPDHVELIRSKNDIGTKEEREIKELAAKAGDWEAGSQIAEVMRDDRIPDLFHLALEHNRPTKIGIVIPDRPKDQPKNVVCQAELEELIKRLDTITSDIEWVPMTAYQIQPASRTVTDTTDPKFQNRSRFVMKKPEYPDAMPTHYIIMDHWCAKGDTMAEMYSLVTDSLSRELGRPTIVMGSAVMRTDFPSLKPDEQIRERFDADFTKAQQDKLDRILHHMGLSVEALTWGQMLGLEIEEEQNQSASATLQALKARIQGKQDQQPDNPLPSVPEPTLQTIDWIARNALSAGQIVREDSLKGC